MSLYDDLKSKATDCHEIDAALYLRAAEEIWCLREVVAGVRVMGRTRAFDQWRDEPWLKRAMNIDLNS